jgi:hypothetical protein
MLAGGRLVMITDGSAIATGATGNFNTMLTSFGVAGASFNNVLTGNNPESGTGIVMGGLAPICTGVGTSINGGNLIAQYASESGYIASTSVATTGTTFTCPL